MRQTLPYIKVVYIIELRMVFPHHPGGVIEEPGGSKLWQVFTIVMDEQDNNL
jgi:hypothetical protein